jgi:sodium transport system permease protein
MTDPGSVGGIGGRLDWRQVGILYLREMRAALHEKTIVINSILLPIFLYPFVMWAAFTGIMFVQGQTEGFVSRVMVRVWPPGHLALRRSLEQNKQIELVPLNGTAEEAEKKIKDGALDALLEFLPVLDKGAALAGNFRARITFNESKERSATARKRVATAIEQYRDDWLKREASARGVSGVDWQIFTVSAHNVASSKQMGAFLLGLVLPIFFVIMVAMGCFYPAVDATAGERERNTWETLMSTAASRLSIVTAKYLYVASWGGLAGILNLIAMMVTIKPIFAPLLAHAGDTMEFTVPLVALPILALASVLLAGFIAAGMMIFAAFARTFKEGQAMITPFYLIVSLPVLFVQTPGLKFSLPLAFLPIVNVTMMVRTAIGGTFPWVQIGITLAVSVALIAACVWLASFILRFEDVVLGSYSGSFNHFIQERVLGRKKTAKRTREVTR